MPCLHCPSVPTLHPGVRVDPGGRKKNQARGLDHSFSRARLIASCRAMIEALVEAAAEVARGGGVGQRGWSPGRPRTPRRVGASLDVLQAGAAAQRVVGDVQHVVGLVVGAVDLEQFDRGVDLAGQADRLDQAGDHPHATMGYPPRPARPTRSGSGLPRGAGRTGWGPLRLAGAAPSPSAVRARACVATVASGCSSPRSL